MDPILHRGQKWLEIRDVGKIGNTHTPAQGLGTARRSEPPTWTSVSRMRMRTSPCHRLHSTVVMATPSYARSLVCAAKRLRVGIASIRCRWTLLIQCLIDIASKCLDTTLSMPPRPNAITFCKHRRRTISAPTSSRGPSYISCASEATTNT